MPMKGNAKNAELFITAMIGPEITAKSTSGTGTAFHLGLIQAKVTWKINIPSKETYVNKTPPPNQGSYSNSHKYVDMCRFAHLSYKLCKYTLTHVSTCWHPSTVACEVL